MANRDAAKALTARLSSLLEAYEERYLQQMGQYQFGFHGEDEFPSEKHRVALRSTAEQSDLEARPFGDFDFYPWLGQNPVQASRQAQRYFCIRK
jgi:hypothetical protein